MGFVHIQLIIHEKHMYRGVSEEDISWPSKDILLSLRTICLETPKDTSVSDVIAMTTLMKKKPFEAAMTDL